MKKYLLIGATLVLFICLFFTSCERCSPKSKVENTKIENPTVNTPECISCCFDNPSFVWKILSDTLANPIQDYLVRGDSLATDKHDPSFLVEAMNKSFPKVQLKLEKPTENTINVRIVNDDYFANQMGSYGVEEYTHCLVFTLTDHTGFKFVNMEFEEGEHAIPGIHSRKEIENLSIYLKDPSDPNKMISRPQYIICEKKEYANQ